jgi:UDP-N-acetylmuramoyl-L-alanyl-D-glutamate--2,6-diaminopimelate ligase
MSSTSGPQPLTAAVSASEMAAHELAVGALIDQLERPVVTRISGSPETLVSGITHDSRQVRTGTLFCCVRGDSADGHQFAADAVAAGATALLVDHQLDLDVAQLVVDDVRRDIGWVAAAVLGHPSRALRAVGVTGTNGKTTTTHLLAGIFDAAGLPCELIGTLSGTRTTPEAPDLQRILADAVTHGRRAAAVEVSSHALTYHRVDGTRFAAGVFTNLGRDHLDVHGTVERYFAAKARLFTAELCDVGVVNLDDVHGRLLADSSEIRLVGYSTDELTDVVVSADRHSYVWRGTRIEVPIGGWFNVSNSLAAATTADVLGIERAAIADGLGNAPLVAGRFEAVDAGQQFSVIVDYAHTPDGLRVALDAARHAAAGKRVIVVFGCGGDRDRDKRPEMGEAAASLADLVIVTSDNPRSEPPEGIVASIIGGVPEEYRRRVTSIVDRQSAIAEALGAAAPGDVVLIAGKGHETTQTIGTEVLPFDDRAVARTLLENLS